MSADQKAVANTDLAKLRLGTISMGRQKGVDSLIVTDLIELARNRAITDALVLSGDEDIRVGVQIAQTYGIQIHLLGIKPSRGSQSESLKQESDTCQEWDETDVGEFLSIRQEPPSKKIDEVIPFVQPDVAKPLEEIMDEQITRMLPVLVSRMQGKTALLMQDPHP